MDTYFDHRITLLNIGPQGYLEGTRFEYELRFCRVANLGHLQILSSPMMDQASNVCGQGVHMIRMGDIIILYYMGILFIFRKSPSPLFHPDNQDPKAKDVRVF